MGLEGVGDGLVVRRGGLRERRVGADTDDAGINGRQPQQDEPCWKANAAPEWQAKSLGWRSSELVVACPLEGLVGLAVSLVSNSPM